MKLILRFYTPGYGWEDYPWEDDYFKAKRACRAACPERGEAQVVRVLDGGIAPLERIQYRCIRDKGGRVRKLEEL